MVGQQFVAELADQFGLELQSKCAGDARMAPEVSRIACALLRMAISLLPPLCGPTLPPARSSSRLANISTLWPTRSCGSGKRRKKRNVNGLFSLPKYSS